MTVSIDRRWPVVASDAPPSTCSRPPMTSPPVSPPPTVGGFGMFLAGAPVGVLRLMFPSLATLDALIKQQRLRESATSDPAAISPPRAAEPCVRPRPVRVPSAAAPAVTSLPRRGGADTLVRNSSGPRSAEPTHQVGGYAAVREEAAVSAGAARFCRAAEVATSLTTARLEPCGWLHVWSGRTAHRSLL